MPRARGERLLTGEWAVLGILAGGPAHGFAIGRRLAPSGDVGRIWSLSRPLAYRALDVLQAQGLIEALRSEPGAGPHRDDPAADGRGAPAPRRVARSGRWSTSATCAASSS